MKTKSLMAFVLMTALSSLVVLNPQAGWTEPVYITGKTLDYVPATRQAADTGLQTLARNGIQPGVPQGIWTHDAQALALEGIKSNAPQGNLTYVVQPPNVQNASAPTPKDGITIGSPIQNPDKACPQGLDLAAGAAFIPGNLAICFTKQSNPGANASVITTYIYQLDPLPNDSHVPVQITLGHVNYGYVPRTIKWVPGSDPQGADWTDKTQPTINFGIGYQEVDTSDGKSTTYTNAFFQSMSDLETYKAAVLNLYPDVKVTFAAQISDGSFQLQMTNIWGAGTFSSITKY